MPMTLTPSSPPVKFHRNTSSPFSGVAQKLSSGKQKEKGRFVGSQRVRIVTVLRLLLFLCQPTDLYFVALR